MDLIQFINLEKNIITCLKPFNKCKFTKLRQLSLGKNKYLSIDLTHASMKKLIVAIDSHYIIIRGCFGFLTELTKFTKNDRIPKCLAKITKIRILVHLEPEKENGNLILF